MGWFRKNSDTTGLDRYERRELEGLRRSVKRDQAMARGLRGRGDDTEADHFTQAARRDQRRIKWLESKDEAGR